MIEQAKTEKPSLLKILDKYCGGADHTPDSAAALPELRAALAAGADVNEIGGYNERPLHRATFKGYNAEVVQLLLEAGAMVNEVDTTNYTPLCLILGNYILNFGNPC